MARKKKDQQELDEIDEVYTKLTGLPAQTTKKRSAAVPVCIAIAIVLVIAVAAYCFLYGTLFDQWLTMPNVTVAGIPLDGMTRREAKAALQDTAYLTTDMAITVEDTTVVLTPEQMSIHPNWNQAVNFAYLHRTDTAFDTVKYLQLSDEALQAVIDRLDGIYNRDLQETVWKVEGTAPSLELGQEADKSGSMTLTVTMGIPYYGLDTAQLKQQILDAYNRHVFEVAGQCQVLEPEHPDAQKLYDRYAIAPTDAVMDPKTFEVSPEKYGYGFDPEKVQEQLDLLEYGKTLTVPFARIPAAVSGESLSSILYRDILGSCKTPYSGSDNNNRNTNLRLACEAINGKIVFPGETFTYNYTLGERTAERGYKPAASYVNGMTVDTYGGGICQVSSTLYYCTLLADLQIEERWHHGFISAYIEAGMDASVSWNSGDFRFTNNFNYPIRIEAYREKGYVYVQLVGTDEKDYYVVMTHETLSSTKYETKYQEITESENKQGYKDGQVLVTPYTGYKVKAYKNKYDKETKELLSTELESTNNYSKRDEVIVKIIKDNEPTEAAKP